MNLFETVLSLTDRLSRKLTPLDAFLQQVVNKVLPHATVQGCSGYACQAQCMANGSGYCYQGLLEYEWQWLYSGNFTLCEEGILSGCAAWSGNCCHLGAPIQNLG